MGPVAVAVGNSTGSAFQRRFGYGFPSRPEPWTLRDTHLRDPRLELVLEELLATRQAHPCARACMLRGAALAHAATAGYVSSIFVSRECI